MCRFSLSLFEVVKSFDDLFVLTPAAASVCTMCVHNNQILSNYCRVSIEFHETSSQGLFMMITNFFKYEKKLVTEKFHSKWNSSSYSSPYSNYANRLLLREENCWCSRWLSPRKTENPARFPAEMERKHRHDDDIEFLCILFAIRKCGALKYK